MMNPTELMGANTADLLTADGKGRDGLVSRLRELRQQRAALALSAAIGDRSHIQDLARVSQLVGLQEAALEVLDTMRAIFGRPGPAEHVHGG